MFCILKHLDSLRIIVLGFLGLILLGAFLLWLPITQHPGVNVSFVDALFTSTSAVCVTGLIAIDTGDTFNFLGRTIVCLLIQSGGLGITFVGVGLILAAGKCIRSKGRILMKETFDLSSTTDIVTLVKDIFLVTVIFESLGAFLSFWVFSKDYPFFKALEISIFHSVAAFNNSGFDILGGFRNLSSYRNNLAINFITCGLIISGGLGFLVIREIFKKHSFKKFSLHTKIVVVMTPLLLISGTLLLKLAENIPWHAAFFYSTSARTAGFSTYPLQDFTAAGLFILIILMFLGASPGSTGGGIKTTTTFVLFTSLFHMAKNEHCLAFKRKIPDDVIMKAFSLTVLALMVVIVGTLSITLIEPNLSFVQVLFEVTSAFGTVGLSTGITPNLTDASKLILITIMFIGRLGPLTMASVWFSRQKIDVYYSEENITIG